MINFKKSIVIVVIVLLAACACMACWSAIKPFESELGTTPFGFKSDDMKTALTITLDTFDSHALSGRLDYKAFDPGKIQSIQGFQRPAIYIGDDPSKDSTGISSDPKLQKDIPSGIHLSDDELSVPLTTINGRGDYYYPFDGYCLTISPKMEVYDSMKFNGEADGEAESPAGSLTVLMSLPNTYRARRNLVPNESNTACTYTPLPGVGLLSGAQRIGIFVDHPWWFRAIIMMLVVALSIPTILTFRKTSDPVAADILTGLAAVGSVRSFIFGVGLTVHFLDIVMGSFLMIVMIVPLVKWGWSPNN